MRKTPLCGLLILIQVICSGIQLTLLLGDDNLKGIPPLISQQKPNHASRIVYVLKEHIYYPNMELRIVRSLHCV